MSAWLRNNETVELTPDGEDSLEDKVERNPVKDSSDTHGFDEVKTSKDDLYISLVYNSDAS
jgi:hypothetical protein